MRKLVGMGRADELFAIIRDGGEGAIDKLIADFESESLWLDFKRSKNDATGTSLDKSDRENLAKAVSGFANADGGIIVWGVDCRPDAKTGADLPSEKLPLQEPHRFRSWLSGALSGCVTPPAPQVEHAVVGDTSSGYV